MLKHIRVNGGNVNNRERDQEASDDGPEKEPVVVNCLENREGAGPSLVHIEQTSMEVLDLPCGNKEEEAQC